MARLDTNLRLDARLKRRDDPYGYLHEVADALRNAGAPVDLAHYTTDRRGCTDAWIEIGDRDVIWSDDNPWYQGWHLTGAGGRRSSAPVRRMHPLMYAEPSEVVAAVLAHLGAAGGAA